MRWKDILQQIMFLFKWAALPTLLVYIFLGRCFLRGLLADARKG